jgi:hypothetical protein
MNLSSLGKINPEGMSAQEVETPEAQGAEVDSDRRIQKDTWQQIVSFEEITLRVSVGN